MKILLFTPVTPFSLATGSYQRTHYLWKALGDIGTVDVVLYKTGAAPSFAPAPAPGLAAEVTWPGARLAPARYARSAALTRLVDAAIDLRGYDVICGRYLYPVCRLVIPGDVATIVDLDDHGLNYGTSSVVETLVSAAKSGVRRGLERRAMRRFDRFWFVTDRDQAALAHLPGGVLRNVPKPPARPAEFDSPGSTILFVGSLWYPPNRRGVARFLDRVWPRVIAAEPQARLRLVGEAHREDRARWTARPAVAAPGFVDDLDAAYREAAFTVAPIWDGGGSNIKVLESLAHGRTCVTTAFSLAAFRPHLDGRTDVLAAADDADMAAACVALLRDAARRHRMAQAGHAVVARVFSHAAFRAAVREQIDAATRG